MNLMKIIKKHWRESNEFYMTVFAAIAFFTFPVWIRVVAAIFYPRADLAYIGSSDIGILQYIVLGWMIFSFSWMVIWLTMKFTFPEIMKWVDDILGVKLYREKPTFDYDWHRAKMFFAFFGAMVALLAIIITVLMP
jgi:hypothetical protein